MAKRSKNQSTGDRGEARLQLMFIDAGYACSDIDPDYGQDFFVYLQDGEEIEPAKIFVQSKASDTFDVTASDWTEYEDPMTVRNWILGSDLTVVVRQNFQSGEIRYSIPEEDVDYRKLDLTKNCPVRIQTQFTTETIKNLIWRARIRHFQRLIQLAEPSAFDEQDAVDDPLQRKLIIEFLTRVAVLDGSDFTDRALARYTHLLGVMSLTMDFQASVDMNIHEKLRYSACLQVIVHAIAEFNQGLKKIFADRCAIFLVGLVIEAEKQRRTIGPYTDEQCQKLRRGVLKAAAANLDHSPFLTPWYDGTQQPENPGVYQRNHDGTLSFSIWLDTEWVGRFDHFDQLPPVVSQNVPQQLPWRGVSAPSQELLIAISAFVMTRAVPDA